jgi:hypothetical protein
MQDAIIVGIVFFSIYKIIELFVKQRERKLLIDKMSQVSPESLQSNINSLQTTSNSIFQRNQFLPLRLGAVAIGVGFGWMLGGLLYEVQKQNYSNQWQDFDSTIIATIALCAGIALIIVYFIERRAAKGSKKEE